MPLQIPQDLHPCIPLTTFTTAVNKKKIIQIKLLPVRKLPVSDMHHVDDIDMTGLEMLLSAIDFLSTLLQRSSKQLR